MLENDTNQEYNQEDLVDSEVIEDISLEALDKVGDVISKIETSKQRTALAQIQATSEDNQRQFEFAMFQSKNANDRWNKALIVGTVAVGVMGTTSIYLLVTGKTDLGLGLLSSTVTGILGYLAGAGANR